MSYLIYLTPLFENYTALDPFPGLRNLRYPGIGVPRKKSESQKKNQHMKK